MTEVVGGDLGFPRWWGGGALFYARDCMSVASDAIDYSPVPVQWGRLPRGPRDGASPWRGV
jgi:hypothetical protein